MTKSNAEIFGEAVAKVLLDQKGIMDRIESDASSVGEDLADFTPSPIEITEAEIAEIKTNIRKAREWNDLAAALIPLAGKVATIILASQGCPVAAASLASGAAASEATCIGSECK